MPYIFIPELNSNFLIDTGSTRSLINPDLAYKFYKNYITKENFNIQTAHSITYHDEIIEIPIFKIFDTPDKHKFYLFKFSNNYEGLIGIDLLRQLKASVDLNSKQIITPSVQVPIIFESEEFTKLKNNLKIDNYTLIIPARTEKIVKIPVNYKEGIAIVNYKNFDKNIESPSALVNIKNYFAITSMINPNIEPVEIIIKKPFEVELLDINEVNCMDDTEITNFEKFDKSLDNMQKENLKNIRLEHCNVEEKSAIRKLCLEYRDIFYNEKIPLSFTNSIKHKIRLSDETPIFTKTYRYPEIHRKEVQRQIDKMLEQDIIQPSTSPWSSPIWVVPKKLDASGQKKWRVVIDYRKLNEKTINDKYPLPNITSILDKLGKSQYFTTLDLASGFHQIELDADTIPKTAFSTEHGHFEFKRMPFGLKTAPPTFQRVMDNVLRGLQNETCLVYLDDIVIYSASLQEHIERLKGVFERLRNSNFKVQLDKCEFLRKEVNYLGHVITPLGTKPNPDKLDAIKKYPIPKTVSEIQSFLGLIGYYRKFVKDLAKITKPLTQCLKKGSKITHNQQFIEAFNDCKKLLVNAPILQYPDFTKEFILTTDASNFALGAVLSQGPVGSDKPIAYASRTLNQSETKYSTIEKELLAIVWACKHFRPYLFGRKFTICTDHRPLTWLFSLREPNSKLIRWRLRLEEFDYKIIYKKGKLNSNADALSRIQINALENESIINNPGEIDQDVLDYLKNLTENPVQNIPENDLPITPSTSKQDSYKKTKFKIISDTQIKNPKPPINVKNKISEHPTVKVEPYSLSDLDETFSEIISLNDDNPSSKDNDTIISIKSDTTPHTTNTEEISNNGIKILDEIINNKNNQIIVYPRPLHKLSVKQEKIEDKKIISVDIPTSCDKTCRREFILEFLRDYITPDKTYHIYFYKDELYLEFNEVCLSHFVTMTPKLIKCTKRVNTISEKDEQIMLVQNHHESKTNHRGIIETLNRLQRNYYWKGMKNTVTNYINSCDTCQRAKYSRKENHIPLMLTETPTKPFQILHIDLFIFNGKSYLTIIDSFTKLAQAFEILGKTAVHVSKALIKFFTSFGVPEKIVADSGKEFKNETVRDLLKVHKINVHFTTVAHHESNGMIERLHSTLIEHLRILQETCIDDQDNIMDYAIIAYNNSIHSSTKFTPFELTFGHTSTRCPDEIFTPDSFYSEYAQNHKDKLKHVYQSVNKSQQTNKEKNIQKHNNSADTQNFNVGQIIYKKNPNNRNKKHNKFLGPYEIIELLEHNKVKVKNKINHGKKKDKVETIHIKEIKKPNIAIDYPSAS